MNKSSSFLAAAALGAAALVPALSAPEAHAAVPMCKSSDMTARYRYSDSGMSHRYGWIVLRNVSGHACTIHGFGGLSYVGHGDGTQIGAAADRVGTARTWTVQPGRRVRAAIAETSTAPFDASVCKPTHVDGFRVYVPNSFVSKFVKHPTTGCANPRVHLLQIKAFRR